MMLSSDQPDEFTFQPRPMPAGGPPKHELTPAPGYGQHKAQIKPPTTHRDGPPKMSGGSPRRR